MPGTTYTAEEVMRIVAADRRAQAFFGDRDYAPLRGEVDSEREKYEATTPAEIRAILDTGILVELGVKRLDGPYRCGDNAKYSTDHLTALHQEMRGRLREMCASIDMEADNPIQWRGS